MEEGCKFEKHSIQQAHVAQLSLSVARASESRWQKIGSGMGTGEGPEGVFILKQLELKEYQDVKKPFVMFGGLNTPAEKWSSGTACASPPDKMAIRR